MPGMKLASGLPSRSTPWSESRTPHTLVAFDERLGHGHAGPDLHGAGSHQLLADQLHELAQRHHQAAILVEERRDVGQLEAVVPGEAQRAEQRGRPARRAGERRLAPTGSSR